MERFLKYAKDNEILKSEILKASDIEGVGVCIAGYGDLDMYQEFVRNEGIWLRQDFLNVLPCRLGQLDTLKWIAQEKGMYPTQIGLMRAAEGGHLDILIWMENRLLPDEHAVYWATMGQHLHVLKWIAEKTGLYPSKKHLDELKNYTNLYGNMENGKHIERTPFKDIINWEKDRL